ncbi:uncharacterized protein TrAFT101_007307 [Trichoderma asperellum]|uniref:uncharacterized protein n=1 Tax=Trichoderma asperellum TaxID=101201 RepID=UPI003331FA8D|nr:hypothetical protein TrAFT101_007307 [Trichoderma asperellum]
MRLGSARDGLFIREKGGESKEEKKGGVIFFGGGVFFSHFLLYMSCNVEKMEMMMIEIGALGKTMWKTTRYIMWMDEMTGLAERLLCLRKSCFFLVHNSN